MGLNRNMNQFFHFISHHCCFKRVIIHILIHCCNPSFQKDLGHFFLISNLQARKLSYSYSLSINLVDLQSFQTPAHATPEQDFLSSIVEQHLQLCYPWAWVLLAQEVFCLYCCIFNDVIPFHLEELNLDQSPFRALASGCRMVFSVIVCIFHDADPFHPRAEPVCYLHQVFYHGFIMICWLMHLKNWAQRIKMDSSSQVVVVINLDQHQHLSYIQHQQSHSIHLPFVFFRHHFHLCILSKTQVFLVLLLIIPKPLIPLLLS